MAVEETPLGYKKPDGMSELVKNGAEVIADNAQKNQDHIAGLQDNIAGLRNSIGVTQAMINAGAGGPGVSEDPDHPGLYYFAGPAFTADPAHTGLYLFEEAAP